MDRPEEPTPLALLRLSGEVSTKAKATRRQFVSRLLRNVRDALASEDLPARIERRHDRIFVELPRPEVAATLARVFGLQSLSVAQRHPAPDLETVVDRGAELFRERVAGRRFAVRARLVGRGRERGFGSRDLEVALGARLLEGAAGVDLSHPEVTARVEVYQGQAYYFTERVPCEGGLPIGTEDRAVALVSGGFDSAVAAWQMLRRGVALDYVFCNLGGTSHRLGTLRVMQVVAQRWSYGQRPRLHALDFVPVSRELQRVAEPRYWQVILKRQMLRAAEAVARERGARAIVTGESVGQVSSQTLANLETISEATRLPLLRPLVGHNKDEIIRLAEHIGTARLSAVVDEYCALVPRRPATAARIDTILEQEKGMDATLLARAVAEREVVDLSDPDAGATDLPGLESDEVPEDAQVVDLRSRREWEAWHWPGSVQLDFAHALEAYPSFGRDQRYLLVCEFGLKSAHLAERMHEAGLRVVHLRGGIPALRKLAARRSGSGS